MEIINYRRVKNVIVSSEIIRILKFQSRLNIQFNIATFQNTVNIRIVTYN